MISLHSESVTNTPPVNRQKPFNSFFNTHNQYGSRSLRQNQHDAELILIIYITNIPLSILDDVHFQRYVHACNPHICCRTSRQITDKLIPQFVEKSVTKHFLPKLEPLVSVAITFDLCMSRGCQDILEEELRKFKLLEKVIACVKDGGTHLSLCRVAHKNVDHVIPWAFHSVLMGSCMCHILAGACNAALGEDSYRCLDCVNLKRLMQHYNLVLLARKRVEKEGKNCTKHVEICKREKGSSRRL